MCVYFSIFVGLFAIKWQKKKIETIYFWSETRVLVHDRMSLSKSTQSNTIDKREMIRLCFIVYCRRKEMKHKNKKYVNMYACDVCVLKINVDFEDVKRNANVISYWQMLWRDSVVARIAAFNAFREFKWFALQEFRGTFCDVLVNMRTLSLNGGSVIVSGHRWNASWLYFARNIAKYTV